MNFLFVDLSNECIDRLRASRRERIHFTCQSKAVFGCVSIRFNSVRFVSVRVVSCESQVPSGLQKREMADCGSFGLLQLLACVCLVVAAGVRGTPDVSGREASAAPSTTRARAAQQYAETRERNRRSIYKYHPLWPGHRQRPPKTPNAKEMAPVPVFADPNQNQKQMPAPPAAPEKPAIAPPVKQQMPADAIVSTNTPTASKASRAAPKSSPPTKKLPTTQKEIPRCTKNLATTKGRVSENMSKPIPVPTAAVPTVSRAQELLYWKRSSAHSFATTNTNTAAAAAETTTTTTHATTQKEKRTPAFLSERTAYQNEKRRTAASTRRVTVSATKTGRVSVNTSFAVPTASRAQELLYSMERSSDQSFATTNTTTTITTAAATTTIATTASATTRKTIQKEKRMPSFLSERTADQNEKRRTDAFTRRATVSISDEQQQSQSTATATRATVRNAERTPNTRTMRVSELDAAPTPTPVQSTASTRTMRTTGSQQEASRKWRTNSANEKQLTLVSESHAVKTVREKFEIITKSSTRACGTHYTTLTHSLSRLNTVLYFTVLCTIYRTSWTTSIR